jgi:uncharacterized phage protein gp47/JayE
MATIGAQLTSIGIQVPDYADILQEVKIQFWQIYGSDADLDDDSMDGQWVAVLAQIIYDVGLVAQAAYAGFSPATAQGTQLSSVVKINGIARASSSNSTATVSVGGVANTTQILNGVIGDNQNLGTQWALPPTVNIPGSGTVDVTATCTTAGAVTAAPGTLINILTPTRGWQTVTNAESAAPGQPVETDAQLRTQQSQSTSLPALSVLDSIVASVLSIQGVTICQPYENDGDTTDGNGLPPHSISLVVEGGDATLIAQAIALKKTPGTGTFGTTSVQVIDQNGVPNTINFFVLAQTEIITQVTITPLTGYVSTTGDALVAAVVAFINGLEVGEESYNARLYTPANQSGTGLGATYVVTSIEQAYRGSGLAVQDLPIAFNAKAITTVSDTSLVVT